ncbi:hypothetical protein JHK87_010079 [Glycine soja]|nr:hypothetical protein JHK87_010079 [Glycine soja]
MQKKQESKKLGVRENAEYEGLKTQGPIRSVYKGKSPRVHPQPHHPPPPLVVAPINVVDHCLPYEKHNFYDVTFNNTVLRDHHHHVLTVGLDEVDVLRDTKQKSTLMAGRLRSVDDHTHKLEVDCNGEGVVFAEAFMARVICPPEAAISIRVRVGVRTSSHSSWCSSSSTCWSSSLSSQQFPFEFMFVTVAFSFVFTVTLDLSSTGPLRVCVYSDPGAHLSVKFPSKFENDLLKDTGWYYKELLEKCGWNGIVEVIEAKGEGDMFHLLNLDCDNAVSLLDRYKMVRTEYRTLGELVLLGKVVSVNRCLV